MVVGNHVSNPQFLIPNASVIIRKCYLPSIISSTLRAPRRGDGNHLSMRPDRMDRFRGMQPKTNILIVDDDPRLLRLVRVNLERVGFQVASATNGTAALDQLALEPPDAVVLDVTMPGMDGFTLTQRIREVSDVPIIFLTAMGEQAQKVRGLEIGGDDYLTKPFDPDELVARLRALLRRSNRDGGTENQQVLHAGDLEIDFVRHRVERKGEQIKLTPTEYKLLQQLAQQAGKLIPHSDLLAKVWGPEYRDETGYLWVYIRALRQKLEEDPSNPRYIISEPGFGYRFQVPKQEEQIEN